MLQYLEHSQEELKQLIRDLCAIPAPSHHEEERAAFCKAWFENNGGAGSYIDEALNVICPYGDTGEGPLTVFMAHTDTVFPDREPMPFLEDAETFRCPAVCDDTANLAVMMICARYFLQNKIPGKTGILFVANSCEEGLGNLKGSRALAKAYGDRITAWISFDGMSLDKIVHRAVGSHRYQVTVRTEGGHSFGAFGNRNAIAVLSSMIGTLYSVKVPQEGTSKTTYNVGTIQGGTSVNTIAQEAEMLYEYRSDNRNCLAKMEDMFVKVVDAYRATGVEIDVEKVGDRPCGGFVDPDAQEKLNSLSAESIRRVTGAEPVYLSGSTDCNIPLSVGIPSVCLGLCVATGAHTRTETLYLSSLPQGSAFCMDFLCHFFD
jgi:acetylornithine deacetylase/succinyl-diaminopimelate desuccinylase-like protein